MPVRLVGKKPSTTLEQGITRRVDEASHQPQFGLGMLAAVGGLSIGDGPPRMNLEIWPGCSVSKLQAT